MTKYVQLIATNDLIVGFTKPYGRKKTKSPTLQASFSLLQTQYEGFSTSLRNTEPWGVQAKYMENTAQL